MNQILLIFCLLLTLQAQIQIKHNTTLADLAKNTTTLDPAQTKAVTYLLQTHPDFADYTVTAINTSINRNSQNYTANLKDYLFELNSTTHRIRALVTLSNLTK